MKSYLISQVLFDGQENIQASAKEAKPLLQVRGSTGLGREVELFLGDFPEQIQLSH